MCGIVGILHGHGRAARRSTMAAMVAKVGHRGPDHTGIVVDGPVGLGVARLSLLDPSAAGSQPFTDDHAALAFNGEIYNHRELGRALERSGVVFRGRSDTEVLFHALRCWGVEATLPKLHGMFAFSFADLERQAVWLCRDRLGIKPLLWTASNGDLAWGSEAKALDEFCPLTPDPVQALFAVVGRAERSTTMTAFAGVRQIPPGHWLRAEPGLEPVSMPWWRLADQVDEAYYRELDDLGPDALVDRFDTLLGDAVEAMSRCDAPMGTFVSGGVDSSLIAALAADRDRDPPRLFTADIGGPRSEAGAASALGARLAQPVDVTSFPPAALLEDWASATWHLESPVVTHLNALPFARLSRTARTRGVKAVLTGEGADELFFGYGETIKAHYRRLLRRPIEAAHRAAERLPAPLGAAVAARSTDQAGFLVDLVGHFQLERLRAEGAEAFGFLPPAAAEHHGAVMGWLGEHLVTLLRRNDAMGMAAGVEARFPFLDEAVVRFGVNAPMSAKVAGSPQVGDRRRPFVQDKVIVRRAAARRLPDVVAGRPKVGFATHGHHLVQTSAAFWADGYVVDLLGLPADAVTHLAHEVVPYHAAKLASVEVFGRLFALGHEEARVTEHVQRHVHLAP